VAKEAFLSYCNDSYSVIDPENLNPGQIEGRYEMPGTASCRFAVLHMFMSYCCYYYYYHHLLSQVFFLPWYSPLEPVVNPTTQASSLSL
jgi:hypothetical protein